MPELKSLKIVVEKMKQLADVVEIKVTSKGEFWIQARTDFATARTMYKGLKLGDRMVVDREEDEEEIDRCFTMDLKHLIKVLYCSNLEANSVIGCKICQLELQLNFVVGLVEDHCFVAHMDMGNEFGSVTYYIPLLNSG
jgi:hypothetical protein